MLAERLAVSIRAGYCFISYSQRAICIPRVINCASFLLPGCKIFLFIFIAQRRTGSIELFASIRRGRFLATSEIFVSPLVNSRIFLKRDIKSRKLYNRLYRFLEINSINGFAIKLNSPSRISLAPVNDRYLSRIWTVQVFQQ